MRFTRLQQAHTCVRHRFTVLTRTLRNRKPAGGAVNCGCSVCCVRPGVWYRLPLSARSEQVTNVPRFGRGTVIELPVVRPFGL